MDPGKALERAGVLHDGVDGPGKTGRGQAKGHLERDAGGQVTLDGLVVRSDTIAGPGEAIAAGTEVITDAVPSVDGVVQDLADGVRLLTIIKDARAATEYAYDFPGAVLTAQQDGSVLVDGEGDNDYQVAPAWAVDDAGVAVRTRYEIAGNTLVQVVEHIGATYPVVADPSISFGWGIYVTYSAAEVRRALAYWWTPYFGNIVCGAIPNNYVKTACGTAISTMSMSLVTTYRYAAERNWRVQHRYGRWGMMPVWLGAKAIP